MSSVRGDGKHYGHGWTRIHTDKKRLGFICVKPCPSVAIMFSVDENRAHGKFHDFRSLDPAGKSPCAAPAVTTMTKI
jgi:hypothetical protein